MIPLRNAGTAALELWLGIVAVLFGVGISLPPTSFEPGFRVDGLFTISELAMGCGMIGFGGLVIFAVMQNRVRLRAKVMYVGVGLWLFIGTAGLLQLAAPTSGLMAFGFAAGFAWARIRQG